MSFHASILMLEIFEDPSTNDWRFGKPILDFPFAQICAQLEANHYQAQSLAETGCSNAAIAKFVVTNE